MSVKEEPEVTVIVVASCERMDYQTSNYSIIDNNLLSSKLARASGMKEMVAKIKFNNLSWVEPWFMLWPEIKIKAVTSNGVTLISDTWFFDRSEVNGVWKGVWGRLGHWYFDDLECLAFKFVENDRDVEI